jgi:riboflavin biosynthesis pyrimidine reductase
VSIIANLVLGSNGGTTITGRSAPLSSPADRKRFHQLRLRADAIVIGGESARREPYAKTPVPLVVVSHSQALPGSAAKNPLAIKSEFDIPHTLAHYSTIFPTILIEGGANFLKPALASGLIDHFYITATQISAEGPFLDRSTLTSGFHLIHEELVGSDLFLHYARLPKNSI